VGLNAKLTTFITLQEAQSAGMPQFALFFRRPALNANPTIYPNFCFDDHFANKQFQSQNVKSVDYAINSCRFIRPQTMQRRFPTFQFFRAKTPAKPSFSTQQDYHAPWLGLPVSLAPPAVPTVVILPLTNAINSYLLPSMAPSGAAWANFWQGAIAPDDVLCKIPQTFKLVLQSDDPSLTANWQNGTTSLAAIADADGLFMQNVTITFLPPAAGTVWPKNTIHVWPSNQDRPRTISVLFNDKVVAQLSVVLMPVINHYQVFINVTSLPNLDGSVNYIFTPCGNIPTTLPMPIALDRPMGQLGTITARHFGQYGINLISVLDPVLQFSNAAGLVGNQRDPGGALRLIGPNVVPTFTLRVPAGFFLTPPPPLAARANFTFKNYFDDILGDFVSRFRAPFQSTFAGPLGLETTQLRTAGGNIIPINQLSFIFVSDFRVGTTVVPVLGLSDNSPEAGLGTSLAKFPPTPEETLTAFENRSVGPPNQRAANNGFLGNHLQTLPDPISDTAFDATTGTVGSQISGAGHSFPNYVCLPDAEQVGGIALNRREIILTHELAHNFGLDHVFSNQDRMKQTLLNQSGQTLHLNFANRVPPGLNSSARTGQFDLPWRFTTGGNNTTFNSVISNGGLLLSPVRTVAAVLPNGTVGFTHTITYTNNYQRNVSFGSGNAFRTVLVSIYFLNPPNIITAQETRIFNGKSGGTRNKIGIVLNDPAQMYNTATGLWKITGTFDGDQRTLVLTSNAAVPPIGGGTAAAPLQPQIFLSDVKPWQEQATWRRLKNCLNQEIQGGSFVFNSNDAGRQLSFNYFDLLEISGYDAFFRVLNSGGRLTIRGNAQLADSTYAGAYNRVPIYNYPPILGATAATAGNAGFTSANNIWGVFLQAICGLYASNISQSNELYTSTYPPTPNAQDQSAGNLMDYDLGLGGRAGNVLQIDNTVFHDRTYLQKHQWDLLRFSARLFSNTLLP
jgi:hypothetical protein